MKEKMLRDESGFTLTEVLVTMMLMLTVMFALYSIFDMSLRVFSFGNDKVEAVENARIGLAKMEREIRAAYPNDKAAGTPDETLFFSPTSNAQITFGLDNVTVNGKVDHPAEEITYELSGTTLMRDGQPTIEFVSGLNFGYLDRLGYCVNSATLTLPPCPATAPTAAELARTKIVKIELTVDKDGRTQTLQTDVSLRNRNT